MATPNELVDGLRIAIQALEVNKGGLRIVGQHIGYSGIATGLAYNDEVISKLAHLIKEYEESNVPEV